MAAHSQYSPRTAAKCRLSARLGFTSTTRCSLFVFFTLLTLILCAESFRKLDIDGYLCGTPSRAIPGECYYLSRGTWRVALLLHLAGIVPGCLLAILQFAPVVRKRFPRLHRVNGYVVVALSLVGMVTMVPLTPNMMGGSQKAQTGTLLLGAMFTLALVKAMIEIYKGRIDLHRAWMLRAWCYVCSCPQCPFVSAFVQFFCLVPLTPVVR